MARTVGIGIQSFEKIRENNCFYVDKTYFIKEWWESLDDVTLITRPRRFGKTLAMSMLENFFSTEYASGAGIFEGLNIWKEEKYRNLQGMFPVISLSFASVKEVSYEQTRKKICQIVVNLYSRHSYLLESNALTEKDRDFYQSISVDMDDATATFAIYQLSEYLCRYYGKKELADKLVRRGSSGIKTDLEELIKEHSIEKSMDEQVVFKQLERQEEAVWSLFLACGYLKVLQCRPNEKSGKYCYELTLTNKEVRLMFIDMIRGWFSESQREYSAFTTAMLTGNLELMNEYMNMIAMNSFSFFDVGGRGVSDGQPESFYHGFVLGLVVELDSQYMILSNRESGLGRYDVVLEPKDHGMDAIILEFKAFDQRREKTLEDTVGRALNQIEEKRYAQDLSARGIPEGKYGNTALVSGEKIF